MARVGTRGRTAAPTRGAGRCAADAGAWKQASFSSQRVLCFPAGRKRQLNIADLFCAFCLYKQLHNLLKPMAHACCGIYLLATYSLCLLLYILA